MPDHVTHYHRASRRPFLNLGDLDPERADEVVRDLGAEAGTHRVFGPRYLALRRATEDRLRELFVAAGGRPQRRSPHYFVLGESTWFSGLADDMTAVRLPLADLPDEATSITRPDSFEAMGLGVGFGIPRETRPYHDRVFRLADLPELVAQWGLPGDADPSGDVGAGYANYHRRPFETYVEVQVWSDAPLARWLPA